MGAGPRLLAALAATAVIAGCAGASGRLATTVTTAAHATTPGANKHAAERDAAWLLSQARVPPGSRELSRAPQLLDGPALGSPSTSSLVDRARFWVVPLGFRATVAWVRDHPALGAKPGGSAG